MNMFFEGLKEKGALVIVPSSAVDSMNLGGLSGMVAMAQNNLPKENSTVNSSFHVKRNRKENKMTTKTTSIITVIMIALALLAGAVLWNQLPDQMASHWNVNDQVDGYHVQILGRVSDAAHHTGNVGAVPGCSKH